MYDQSLMICTLKYWILVIVKWMLLMLIWYLNVLIVLKLCFLKWTGVIMSKFHWICAIFGSSKQDKLQMGWERKTRQVQRLEKASKELTFESLARIQTLTLKKRANLIEKFKKCLQVLAVRTLQQT